MDHGTSASHGKAVRAHAMGLALACGFVESVGNRQAQSGHFILSTAPTELDVRPSALAEEAGGVTLIGFGRDYRQVRPEIAFFFASVASPSSMFMHEAVNLIRASQCQ